MTCVIADVGCVKQNMVTWLIYLKDAHMLKSL